LDKVIGPVLPGDVFLLCTDGVWKSLAADDLAALLQNDADTPMADRLVAAALERDASDNVTAVAVTVLDPADCDPI
jgi:serine/threonine protein phosphatase PrpC